MSNVSPILYVLKNRNRFKNSNQTCLYTIFYDEKLPTILKYRVTVILGAKKLIIGIIGDKSDVKKSEKKKPILSFKKFIMVDESILFEIILYQYY